MCPLFGGSTVYIYTFLLSFTGSARIYFYHWRVQVCVCVSVHVCVIFEAFFPFCCAVKQALSRLSSYSRATRGCLTFYRTRVGLKGVGQVGRRWEELQQLLSQI